jgi:ABC-type transporter Mla subunit MlaD
MNPIFMYVVWSTIAVAAVMSSLFLFRLLIGLGPLIQRLEAIAQWLEAGRPRYVQILEDLEAQIGELRGISESVHHMARKAEDFTDTMRTAAQPIVDEVQDLSRIARQAHAVLAATRSGLAAFFLHRRDAVRAPESSVECFQES